MGEPLTKPAAYDEDFYAWTRDQAAKLRARAAFDNCGDIDWEHAAEEIEGLGSSEESEIESRLAVLLLHLLKWRFQPGFRSSSWRGSIREQRSRLLRRIRKSPSLRNYPLEVVAEEYQAARLKATGETGLADDAFPAACPFTIEQILDPDFYPEEAA